MNAIEVHNLSHRYNGKTVYQELTFTVPQGSICGLLGKNGQGKTTLVNILMGFLKPTAGSCLVLGENSHSLPPDVRRRVGLLHEGHQAYEFMTITQTERYFRGFYPDWNADIFYSLVKKMGLSGGHKVGNMSCGQRSQVVLGVIMAQNPDLLILDDYSMGLDAGYRRLFLDVLHDFAAMDGKTIFVTSHIVQDLEQLVDTIFFLDQGRITRTGLKEFLNSFKKYVFQSNAGTLPLEDEVIKGVERRRDRFTVYSYQDPDTVTQQLSRQGVEVRDLRRADMTLEDGFIGLMGKY
jgi:ABC-2 type transport system ATP-binding protein